MKNFKTNINIKLGKEILKKYSFNSPKLENQKTVAYLYIILTLFSVSFFGFFAINPALSKISALKRQYEDSKIVNESITQKIDALRMLSTQYQQLEPLINTLYLAIPLSPRAAYLSRQLEEIAKENNISLSTLEVSETEIFPTKKKGEEAFEFETNIAFSGSVEDMINLTQDIVNFDRIINIKNASISLDDQEKGQFNISLKGVAYFNKE